MTAAKKNQPNSVGQKKMCLIKMTVAKKIGAKQLKKIAPYKNDCCQKKSEQISCKKWHLIKMTAQKKPNQTA